MKLTLALLSLVVAIFSFFEKIDKAKSDVLVSITQQGHSKEYIFRTADILLMRAILLPIDEAKLNKEQKADYQNIRSVFTQFAQKDANTAASGSISLDYTERKLYQKIFSTMLSPNVWIPLLTALLGFIGAYRDHKKKTA